MAEIRSCKGEVQIKNRLAAHRKKFGSPDFKDILRKKCRARIKAKRGDLFNQLRSLDSEEKVHGALATILEHDINSLSVCEETDDLMDTSVCDDEPNLEERWILNEYERLMENNMALIELEQQVVCPICEKGVLQYSPHRTICSLCTLVLPSKVTLGQLEQLILEAIDSHSNVCQNKPQFTIIPDNNTTCLLLVCCSCNYFYLII